MEVREMSREMIFTLPQLKELFDLTTKLNLNDIVYSVYGGNPSDYEKFWGEIKDSDKSRDSIGELLCDTIVEAIALKNNPGTLDFISLYMESIAYGFVKIKDVKVVRPSPDKVFRETWINGVHALVPISNAMEIVLKHKLEERPTFEQLEAILK
jgi:hypothetical protein